MGTWLLSSNSLIYISDTVWAAEPEILKDISENLLTDPTLDRMGLMWAFFFVSDKGRVTLAMWRSHPSIDPAAAERREF